MIVKIIRGFAGILKKSYFLIDIRPINTNKVQALLEWRDQMGEVPMSIIMDDVNVDKNSKLPAYSKVKISKNICNQSLEEIGNNIEALFINIDWGKKGQTMKDFTNLKLDSNKFMQKGIIFIWAPK